MAKTNTKKQETVQETTQNSFWNLYGSRISKSCKRLNISLCRSNEDGEREWATVSISLYSEKTPIRVYDNYVYIKIKRLDAPLDDEDEDEPEQPKPRPQLKPKAVKKAVKPQPIEDDNDMPF